MFVLLVPACSVTNREVVKCDNSWKRQWLPVNPGSASLGRVTPLCPLPCPAQSAASESIFLWCWKIPLSLNVTISFFVVLLQSQAPWHHLHIPLKTYLYTHTSLLSVHHMSHFFHSSFIAPFVSTYFWDNVFHQESPYIPILIFQACLPWNPPKTITMPPIISLSHVQ